MGEPSNRRMFSEIMATGLEKSLDETETNVFGNTRKNLASVFKKSSSNVEAGEEHMKCYLRIRPFSEGESDRGENQECIDILDDNTILTKAPKESHTFKHYAHGLGKTSHKFTFSRIFDEDTTQKEFFDDTMLSLVRDFIDGQNCLVFTYGVTSSGKTYTIQGKQSDAGILPRVLDVLFNSINNKQLHGIMLKPKMFMDVSKLNPEETEIEKKIKDRIMKMSLDDDNNVMMLLGEDASDISQGNTTTCSESSNISSLDRESKESHVDVFDIENRIREETKVSVEDQGQMRFSIWCSFAEIYNEQIFDLLEPMPKKKNAKRPVLRLSDDKNGSPYIKGLKEVNVTTADEAYKLLNIGQRNLSTACTKLNHSSSRSHCIFNIKIIRVLDKGNPKMARVSMLSLCDLAGSERSSKTLSQGERLKEAGNINTSLMTLGRCIEMLRFNQNHKENNRIIPFRDSKLTRLFQNFFCGRGKAAMIVNVNQCASMFDETLHVFKFSAIAKQVVVHQKAEISKPKSIAANKSLRSRAASIMWDTPGAMMKYNSQFAETTEEEEDDTEDENLDASMSELQEALNIIEHLQNQLSEERKERALMEARIREEVCKEMMQQIVSIEENYNDMLRENKIHQEEIVEERVKMLMESVHRPRKRARGDKNDENTDEWVPAIRLKAEEFKVKDLNEKYERMGKEISELNAEVFRLTKTNESMTKLQTSLEFKLADSQSNMTQLTLHKEKDDRKIHDLEKNNQKLTKNVEELRQQVQQNLAASGYSKEEIADSEFIDVLSQQLQQAKDTVHEQEMKIEELGETLQEKNEEISKLMEAIEEDEKKLDKQAEVISEMHNMLEESKTAVESSQTRIQDKDQKILGLETTCSEKQVEIEKLTKQLAELENGGKRDQYSGLDLREELKKTEAEMEKLNEILIDKDEEIVSLQSKLKNEEQESFKRHQALINGYNAEITSYKTQTLELRAKLSGFHKTDSELQKTKEQAKCFKTELIDQVKELQEELMKNTAMTAELEQGSKLAKKSNEELEKHLEIATNKNTESKKLIAEYEAKLNTVGEDKDEKCLNHKKNARNLRTELNTLQESLKTKDQDLENIKIKMADIEFALEKKTEKKAKVDEELDRLKKLVNEKDKCIDVQVGETEKLINLKDENERLKDLVQEKDKCLDSAATDAEKATKLSEDLERMKEEMKVKEELTATLSSENRTLTSELDKLKELAAEKNELSNTKTEEINSLKAELERLNELVAEKDELIEKHEGEMEIMMKLKDKLSLVQEGMIKKETEILKLEDKVEELETVKKDLKDMVNKTTGDLEDKNIQLKDLEVTKDDFNKLSDHEKLLSNQIQELKKQITDLNKTISAQKSELGDKTANCENLNTQISELTSKLNAQTTTVDQIKAELSEFKSNLYQLQEKLNTSQTTISELETKLSERDSELDNKAKNRSEITDKVLELTETLTKQNNLVDEKEAEVKSVNFDLDERVIEIDELNQKLKSAEQTSNSLNEVIADLKSKQLTEDQTWQTTVSNLEKSNKNLEEKLAESKERSSSVKTNQKDLQEKISSLENSKKLLQEELHCFQSNLETLTCEKFEIIQSNEEKIKSAENSKKGVEKELKDVKEELVRVTEEKEDLSVQLTNQRQALEDFRNEIQASMEEMKDIVSQKETELNEVRLCCKELKNELPDTRVKIAELKSALHMEKTLQKKYKDEVSELTESKMEFEKRLANKDRKLELLKMEEAKLEKEISKLGSQLKEEKSTREKLENKMVSDSDHEKSSMTKMLSSKDEELDENKREIADLKSKLESVQSEYSKLSDQSTKLSETGNKMADSDTEYLKSELQSEQIRAMKLEAAIKEYQTSETDKTPGNARRLRKEKIEAESLLINAQYEIENLTRKLKCLEEGREIPSPVSDIDLLQKLLKSEQEIEKLQSKIKSLEISVADNSNSASSVGKDKFESEITELRAELKEKEQKIQELSVKTSKDNLKQSTTETTLQELTRSQDRELNLRQQLKEAGETMKEHSENMAKLEDKLHTQRNELLDLQSKLKTLQNEKEDWLKASESHKVYEDKIQELKAEIERKNSKLESKHSSNIELRQTMEGEKEKFHVALKDAQANEAVLESLKDALTEQEETMEKQDEILKKREDEIKLINSELEKMTNKYQNLLESSGGSGREIRELNKRFTLLESEKSQLEKQNQTLKQSIEKMEKDLKNRDGESQELNDQISALKQDKSALDAKLKKESAELDQFYKDLDKLKLEKESLEKLLKENNQCSNKLDVIMSAKSSLESDKTVLKKQKTDLENVKSELEKVNRELVQEKCELEKVNEELVKKMSEMKSSNSELEKERSSLQKSCDKLSNDKETLNKVIKENNNDIAELEKVLTDSRKEVEEFKCKMSEEVQGKVNQDKAENKTLIDDIKTKLRDKESEIRKLNKEIEKLSTQIETMNITVTQKEKEMETWRKSRDDLVGSLESLMKKQAAEIKDLKEQRVNQSRKDLIEELELKEERIRELEEQVDQAEVEVKHQTPTRGRCRKRSNIAGISIVEIDNMRKQLEKEREEKLIMQRNLQMMQKCKDSIISDIRQSNHSLQGVQAPPTPPNPAPVIKLEPTFEDEEEDISDHIQLDATPTMAAKALRKGRKRGSANSTESEPLVPKSRRRGRQAAGKIKTESVDEDSVLTPIDLQEIKEEDNEEETGSKRPGRKAKQVAKNKLVDTAIGSPLTRSAKKSESMENIVPDTPETETKPRGGRKKRILYNTDEIHITPPFECGNFVPSSVSNEQRTSSRLRGRKQSAV